MENACNKISELCTNTFGSYICTCKSGFIHTYNECKEESNPNIRLIVGFIVGISVLLVFVLHIIWLLLKYKKNCTKTKYNYYSRESSNEIRPEESSYEMLQVQTPFSTTIEGIELQDLEENHLYTSLNCDFNKEFNFIYSTVYTKIKNDRTVYEIAQFKKFSLNPEFVQKQYIRNQYLALSNSNRKLKNSRLMNKNNITSIFSDIAFIFKDKFSNQNWLHDTINESSVIILIASAEEAANFIPKNNQPIITSKFNLSLVTSSETTYGLEIKLKLTKLENSAYLDMRINKDTDQNNNPKSIIVHHILNKKNLSLQTWKSFFEEVLKKDKNIYIYSFCKDTNYASLLIAIIYILATLKDFKLVCIFLILKNLFTNYKDFYISEEFYFDIHKFILEYLNQ